MKFVKKAIVITFAALTSQAAIAQSAFTDSVTVTSVIPSSGGNVVIGASPTVNPNPAGCTFNGFVLSADDAGFTNMYAGILTAFASGGTVSFGLSTTSCTGVGTNGFPLVQGAIVSPPS